MKKLPKISIVMPVLNGEKTIEKAIKSLIAQDYPNLEWIVMDGGSTDNTEILVKKYSTYLTMWCSSKDGSPNIAINEGIKKSTGDLVALLMTDDWYEPGILLKVGQAHAKSSGTDIITCGGRLINHDGNILQVWNNTSHLNLNFKNICFGSSVICCRFLSKGLFEKIGYLKIRDNHNEHMYSADKELLLRSVLYSSSQIFIPDVGYNYLSHPGSSTFSFNRKNRKKLCREHLEICLDYLQNKKLSLKQKNILKKWYNDQAIRLMLYQLLDKDFKLAAKTFRNAITSFTFSCLIATITTPTIISVKACKRFINKVFHQKQTA